MNWILSYWGLAALTLLLSIVSTAIAYGIGDFLVKRGWFISAEVDFGALANVGAVFAVALGLMTVGVWGGYSNCKDKLPRVVDAVSEVYRLSDALSPQSRDAVRKELARYLMTSSPMDRTDLIAHRRPAAWAILISARTIALTAARQEVREAWQILFAEKFSALFTARRDWLNSFDYRLHPVIWVSLLIIAQILLIGTALYPKLEPKQRVIGLLVFAVPVVVVFLTMLVLSYPLFGICEMDTSYLASTGSFLQDLYGHVYP